MAVESIRESEISLFGNFYPIVGGVTLDMVSQWPQKMQTVGDYSKDSEVIASSWVISNQTGGLGIKDMEETKDANRFWWGTCNTDYKNHLVLPALATDCSAPTTGAISVLIDFNDGLYVVQGAKVYKWNEATEAWGALLHTLGEAPTDARVYKRKLYFACGLDFERFDGTNWTDGATLSGSAVPSRYFEEWDEKLFALSNAGQIAYTTDEGVTWTNNAASLLESGSFNSLFLYRNTSGTIVIHLGTKIGIYVLDYTNAKWIPTELILPKYLYGSKGATAWRDAVYIPFGMGLYHYVSSNPAVVTPIGLDRDYGVPTEYSGNIKALAKGINALFAMVDASNTVQSELLTSGYLTDMLMPGDLGFSWIARWDTGGWRAFWISGDEEGPITTVCVCSADGEYRLWFGQNEKVFYIPLDADLYNPLEMALFEFKASGEHITPWFDADNAVIDKLAVTVIAYATDVSVTDYIKIYYGTDYVDSSWTLLTNTTFADGKIDSAGEARFTLASDAGVVFKSIRFKIELVRGTTKTISPDLRWLRLSYIKLLDTKWSFSMVIDCSRDYRDRKASALLATLKTAAETQTLGEFIYRNNGSTETRHVRVANLQGKEVTGKNKGGLYSISLIAP